MARRGVAPFELPFGWILGARRNSRSGGVATTGATGIAREANDCLIVVDPRGYADAVAGRLIGKRHGGKKPAS